MKCSGCGGDHDPQLKLVDPKCLDKLCQHPVQHTITNGNGKGYCMFHRQRAFDYNRGMA